MVLLYFCDPQFAHARFFDTYRADYIKGAPCVAIGAACVSDVDPELSFFQNPAALLGDPENERGLVFDGDYQFQSNSSAIEPGQPNPKEIGEQTFLFGIGNAGRDWGMALSIFGRFQHQKSQATIFDPNGNPSDPFNVKFNSTIVQANVPISFEASSKILWAFGFSFLYYHETLLIDNAPKSSTQNIDKFPYPGLRAGLIYKASPYLRYGFYGKSPTVFYFQQNIVANSNAQAINYTEDIGLINPWIVGNGMSWMPWGDGRTILFDVDLIGRTPNAFQRTVDVFGSAVNDRGLRAKGADYAFEPHLGFRMPWWSNSRGTWMMGSYYENGRWQDISGRGHLTGGLAYKINPFGIGLELVGSIDIARDFFDFEFTIR